MNIENLHVKWYTKERYLQYKYINSLYNQRYYKYYPFMYLDVYGIYYLHVCVTCIYCDNQFKSNVYTVSFIWLA